ncbi:MAG: hypothetical protein ACOYOU_16325 [Kiritimatiellia bacterium]
MIIPSHISGFRSSIINALIDAVARQRPIPGPGLLASETPGGTLITLARAAARPDTGFPYGPDKFLWGIDHEGAVLTVGAGMLRRAGDIFTCEQADITITADGQYVGWTLTHNEYAAWILAIDPAPHDAIPADSDGIMRGPLYRVSYSSTLSAITGVCTLQCGIVYPALFGA